MLLWLAFCFAGEFIILVRRIVLVSLTVTLSQWSRPSLFSFLTLCNIGFLFLHMFFAPFRNETENTLETFSLVLLAITTTLLAPLEVPLSNENAVAMVPSPLC